VGSDSRPYFSVIVPTRNRSETLERALLGINEQTFAEFEVIVVDDGSSAEQRERYEQVMRRFDQRFTLRQLDRGPQGSGPSFVRNHGIAAARGRFIAFCDDDDYWCDKEHLAVAAEALQRIPAAKFYFANQRALRDGAVVKEQWWPALAAIVTSRPGHKHNIYTVSRRDIAASREYAHLNTCIVERSLAEAIGGFWERVSYWEDSDFFLRAIDRVEVALFRTDIVSVHIVPNRALQVNASTRLQAAEKLIVSISCCQHVRACADSPEMMEYARQLESWGLQNLAKTLRESGRPAAAVHFAWQALAVHMTLRWLVYTVYIALVGRLRGWLGMPAKPSRAAPH
jgi:glycosyltransferase involved in cell wall biosynthesis